MAIRRITSLFLTALVVVFAPNAPARAAECTCAAGQPVEMVDSADLAFVGMVIEQQPSFDGESIETLFAIDQVVQGDPEPSQIVVAPADTECGGDLPFDEPIGVTAESVAGEVLPQLCVVMEPSQLLAAADELGLEVRAPIPAEVPPTLPESSTNYAAAIPLSIILSLVFLGAVALGTRTQTPTHR